MALPFHQIKNKETPAVVTYKDRPASDHKAALFNEFFSTLYSSNHSPNEDLIDDLVHSDPLLKMSFTQDEVEDILVKLNVQNVSASMASPRVF